MLLQILFGNVGSFYKRKHKLGAKRVKLDKRKKSIFRFRHLAIILN